VSARPVVAAVYGAATPPGRLAVALGASVAWLRDQGGAEVASVDLHETRLALAGAQAAGEDEATRAALETVQRAGAVLVASPVYRASFPGVLKNLFDLLPVEALRGKPVGLIVVGATSHHFLGVDRHVRDVLSWFGALALPVSVYLTSGDFAEGELGAGARTELEQLAAALLSLARAADPGLGPPPLAARHA
jgi:FMN reductase